MSECKVCGDRGTRPHRITSIPRPRVHGKLDFDLHKLNDLVNICSRCSNTTPGLSPIREVHHHDPMYVRGKKAIDIVREKREKFREEMKEVEEVQVNEKNRPPTSRCSARGCNRPAVSQGDEFCPFHFCPFHFNLYWFGR